MIATPGTKYLDLPARRMWQREAFDLNKMNRFQVLLCHRGAGKTFGIADFMTRMAMTNRDIHLVYAAPVFKLILRSFWQHMLKITRSMPDVNPNRQDMAFHFGLTNSTIWCISLSDVESQRGIHPAILCCDESQDIDTDDFKSVLFPTLHNAYLANPEHGRLIVSGTAKYSDNLLADAHVWANDGSQPLWSEQVWSIYDTKLYTNEYIDTVLKPTLTEQEFNQEFLCQFEFSDDLLVYRNYSEVVNLRQDIPIPPDATLHIGLDFNVSPMSAEIGIAYKDGLYVFDEIAINNSNTEQMAVEILNRYPNRKILIHPDQSGRSRKTSSVTDTDFTILRKFKLNIFERPGGNLPVLEGVRNVNMMLKNAAGQTSLYVHPRCKILRRGLKTLRYKEGTSIVDEKNYAEHATACLRYLCNYFAPYVGRRQATTTGFRL